MHKGFIQLATFLGGLSVALGAFAAHKLKELVSEQVLGFFETGVRYQFYHVFALALAGIVYKEFSQRWIRYAGNFFIAGIICFSGSLYFLTVKAIIVSDGFRWVYVITPVGGLFFIAGWACLGLGISKGRHS